MTPPELTGDVFDAYMTTYGELAPEFLKQYVRDHRKRFLATLRALPPAGGPGARGLEIGTYGLFPVAMRQMLGYADADGVVYETKGDVPLVDHRRYPFDGEEYAYRTFDLDAERTRLPVADESYDLVVLAEVLEHFAADPYFCIREVNRILKPGGKFLITTPNVCSTEHIFRILTHDVPTWFYFYRKDRSNDRHNLEYSPKLLRQLVEHGGFTVNRLWTEVFWSGDRPEIDRLLDERGYSRDLRGDDMFVLCEKSGPAGPSFPDFLYF